MECHKLQFVTICMIMNVVKIVMLHWQLYARHTRSLKCTYFGDVNFCHGSLLLSN